MDNSNLGGILATPTNNMDITRAERREKKRKKRMKIHGKMDALINSISKGSKLARISKNK